MSKCGVNATRTGEHLGRVALSLCAIVHYCVHAHADAHTCGFNQAGGVGLYVKLHKLYTGYGLLFTKTTPRSTACTLVVAFEISTVLLYCCV